MADASLPEGWEAVKSGSTCARPPPCPQPQVFANVFAAVAQRGVCVRSGETYYRNTHTTETTWDEPTAPAPKEVSALPEGWEAVTSSK